MGFNFIKLVYPNLLPLLQMINLFSISPAQSYSEPIRYSVDEEINEDYLIGNIVVDAHLPDHFEKNILKKLQFIFLTQNRHRDLFFLGETTGEIRTAIVLDRDIICPGLRTCSIELDIAVRPVEYFLAIKVIIEILDLNDNAPKFPQKNLASSISESTMPGVLFPIPAANDPDSPKFNIKSYEFHCDSSKFELKVLNNSDGSMDLQLILLDFLDREKRSAYDMKIIAYDGGKQPQIGILWIHLTILDVNDNSPHFLSSSYSVNISESTSSNATIIQVSAKDPDSGINGEIVYGFTSKTFREHGSQFGIKARTGEIFLKKMLDYEKEPIYNLGVTAQDKGADSLPSPTNVLVNVIDVNDNAPFITLNALKLNENVKINENSDVPIFVAYISVFDPDSNDGGVFTCTLNDYYFSLIQLYDTEFKIMAVSKLDREKQAYHKIKIVCIDHGLPSLTSTEIITIIVEDSNDNSPTFTQHAYYATLIENNEVGESILQVTAIDRDEADNSDVTYRLDINAQADFSINSKSGMIYAGKRFDREIHQNFEFMVYGADSGNKTDSATIIIAILDDDDNAPKFTQSRFVFDIAENTIENLGYITASDSDLPPYNDFTFYFLPGQKAAELFSLHSTRGLLALKTELDREIQEAFQLLVSVGSTNLAHPNDTAEVIIYVNDVNDNSPVIDYPISGNDTVLISSHIPVGFVIAHVRAFDIDYGKNAQLEYSISGGNEQNQFLLGLTTGDLFINRKFELLERTVSHYKLVCMVKDLGFPQKISVSLIHIIVNSSLPFIPPSSAALLWPLKDMELVVIVISLTTVIATILIVAIIYIKCCCRKRQKNSNCHYINAEYPIENPNIDQKLCDNTNSLNFRHDMNSLKSKQILLRKEPILNQDDINSMSLYKEKVGRPAHHSYYSLSIPNQENEVLQDYSHSLDRKQSHPQQRINSISRQSKNEKRFSLEQINETKDLPSFTASNALWDHMMKPVNDTIKANPDVVQGALDSKSDCASFYRNKVAI